MHEREKKKTKIKKKKSCEPQVGKQHYILKKKMAGGKKLRHRTDIIQQKSIKIKS